ncbi:MAG: hypothetical protein ABS900_05875 [Candidatus Limivicinus sp.]
MKKLVSLFVALCMVFTMIPALAETVSEEAPIEEQTTEQEADIGKLLGLLGSEASEGEEGADPGLSALLGGLLGSEESETKSIETVYAAAETKEQFFGTWNLTKATIFDVPVTLEDVASLLEIPLTLQVIVADGSFAMVAEGEPKPEEVTMELVDGALSLTQEGDETMVLKLTDAGELVMEIGFVSLYFVPAPVAAE